MSYDDWKTTPPPDDGVPCAECGQCEARIGSNYCSESCLAEAFARETREGDTGQSWKDVYGESPS